MSWKLRAKKTLLSVKKEIWAMSKKNKLILGLLMALIFSQIFLLTGSNINLFAFPYHPPGKQYVVVLTDNGFDPQITTVRQWDTVRFTTNAGKPFWPASDLHPTHEIYPTFDPKRPIEPNNSWIFQFDQVGEWHFHDHLLPYYKGIIKVLGTDLNSVSLNCSGAQVNEECWSQAVDKTVNEKGVDAAFDLVTSIYNNNSKGAEACHSLTHELGNDTFILFHNHKDFKITAKASLCNYGFYHGFMEKLVGSGADMKEAGDFCNYIDQQLSKEASQSGGQCYHGIGHGTVSAHDQSLWGNAQAMIDPALRLCEEVSKTDDNLFRCVSGIYNGIGNFYIKGDYKLAVDKTDPYKICRSQPAKYQVACYGDLHPTITWITGNDFQAAAKFAEAIPDDTLAKTALSYVVSSVAPTYVGQDNYNELIANCRTVQVRLTWTCITGYVSGLMILGRPNQEYIDAFRFCKSSGLSSSEEDSCFAFVVPYLGTLYSKDKFRQVCSEVDSNFHKYCPT